MSGRIKEGNLAVIDLDDRCTDMLCDAAGLPGSHIGLADCIQKGSLAVVNMAHDTHNR